MIRLLSIAFIVCITACTAFGAASPTGNFGFENDTIDWGLSVHGNCRLTMTVEKKNPYSGSKSVVFTCKSPVTPHVYGRLMQNVSVTPNTEYVLSAWVRAIDNAGMKGETHFTDWNTYLLPIPGGTYGWRKVTTTFKTRADQNLLALGFNIADKCTEMALDDIALYPASQALKADGIDGYFFATPRVIGNDAPGGLSMSIDAERAAKAEVSIAQGDQKLLSKRVNLKSGPNTFAWPWSSGKVPFGQINCSIRILDSDGKLLVSGSQKIEKIDSPLVVEVDKSLIRFKEFNDLYKQCADKKIRMDYPTAVKTTLDQFIPFAYEDIQKGHDWRAKGAAKDFAIVIDDAISYMKDCIADPSLAPKVPRYQTSEVNIDGLSLIGDKKDNEGRSDRGPLFFCGHGHFGAVRTDMPLWPGYGVNIIQTAEIGPSVVFPKEDKVDLKQVKIILKAFDNAAKNNVKVDFLLSPHYFPDWAMEKWPDLAKGSGGFLGFNVDAPEAKQVVEKYLRLIVPMFKDKPALLSFCLTNEPLFNNTVNTPNVRPMFSAYLKKVHGDIETLNRAYGGTNYKSFDDVPVGGSWDDPNSYDYCVFNNERFAGWHKWMADIIHEMAPNIPIHAKIMSTQLNRDFAWMGTDHELFGQLLDMNGNDCYCMGAPPKGYSVSWQMQNSSYDMQRSFVNKPIFNSENHLVPDTANYYLAPEHYRYALWQGAIHGQGATTIWVWERSLNPSDALYGSIKDRPGCALAVGTTCMDLNRFADEVTALQNAKSPVAILYSTASVMRNQAHIDSIWSVYTALNFCGVRVDFISEKQLVAGKGKQYKMIVLPESTHVPQPVFDAIKGLLESVKLIIVNDCLVKNPYNIPFPTNELDAIKSRALRVSRGDSQKDMWPMFMDELSKAGGLPGVSVVDASTGKPVWGIEWVSAKVGGRTVINIVNVSDKPVDVKVQRFGIDAPAKDLLSLGASEPVKTIRPMFPVLAEIVR
ncbi:MAG: beta-galactosidase [Armatimonadota bacterium]